MRRVLARGLGLLLLGLVGFCLWNPAEYLLDRPQRTLERRRAKLERGLAGVPGLLHLWTFDEPRVRDWMTGREGLAPGTVVVPAHHGFGRKFNGEDRTHVDLPVEWRSLGSSFTIALWIKIDRRLPDQDILCSVGWGDVVGFRLEGRRLVFDVPGAAGKGPSYPFEHFDEFVHLAAVVDGPSQSIVLYENGARRAADTLPTLALSSFNMAFGKPLWCEARNPFRGVVDETAIWRRALDDGEVARLAASPVGLLQTLVKPKGYLRWQWARRWAAFLEGVASFNEGLVPFRGFLRSDAGHRSERPRLGLVMSQQDRRHFVSTHHRSRMSGRRTQQAAAWRDVHVAQDGRVRKARVCLAGTDTAYTEAVRPSYVVEVVTGDPLCGSRRLLLRPPESAGFLAPWVTTRLRGTFGVPSATNGLCSVSINGDDQGVYWFEDYQRNGVHAGDFQGVAGEGGPYHMTAWRSVFRNLPWPPEEQAAAQRKWPLSSSDLLQVYEQADAAIGNVLRWDVHSPLSRLQVARSIERDRTNAPALWPSARDTRSPAQAAVEFLDEYLLLGPNSSPYRVVEDLVLDSVCLPGVTIAWHSSDPAVIDPQGRVRRPSGAAPQGVTLTAVIQGPGERIERPMAFRVMPASPSLPAVMLYVSDTIQKSRRVDAVVEVCEPGEDHPSRVLLASQGGGGGLSHRGNSSYWSAKRLFALRTDEPHRLVDDSERSFLQTVNSMQDATFVHNALAYSLFREFGGEETPRPAPFVRPAEFFVNGRYYGLLELCTRIDETLLPNAAPDGDVPDPPMIVYKHRTLRPRVPEMRVARPSNRRTELLAPFVELERYMRETPTERWVEDVGRTVDVASVIDLQLLLNLAQNQNGVPYDFLAHDILVYSGGFDGRFYHVPWDFDRSFRVEFGWIANDMMRRFQTELPGYWQRLDARWRELRRGVLDVDRMLARVDQLSAPLAGYVEWDYRRWDYSSDQTHAQRLDELREHLRSCTVAMDRYLTEQSGRSSPKPALPSP